MTAELFEKIVAYNKAFDRSRIKLVLDFVNEKYRDTDGNLDYTLEILEILLPLRPDEDTVVAVFLHDLYNLSFLNDQTVRDLFGQQVLNILIALKRLVALNYGENERVAQVEILRKMFLTMAKDLRVILIWLAQRLAYMQNLESLPEVVNNLKIARETMNVYVPIASRLGIYRMKTQLEDLSFKYLDPSEYERINRQIVRFGEARKLTIESMRQRLENFLFAKGIKAEVFGRLKNVFSIYTKLTRKGVHCAEDLYDLFAMRIVLPVQDQIDHLYTVLGLIHSEWKPISRRFKDYVAVPKPNGYRSLHTVVLGLAPKDLDQPVEVQIRDEQMHRESEFGVASHWLYKNKGKSDLTGLHSHVEWLMGLERIHEFFDSEAEVMKEVAVDIFKDRIFVLTPRGEVKDLPSRAIPIDFAYAVHTDVGNRCVSARVNGAMVPLDYELKNGEVVEIITKKEATPKLRWLSMVKTGFARNKIKAWFSGQNWEKNIREGKRLMNIQLERLGKPHLDQNYSILKNYSDGNLNLLEREGLLEEIGKGGKFVSDIIRKIYPYEKNLITQRIISKAEPDLKTGEQMLNEALKDQVLVAGEVGLPTKMASCCSPKLGDNILGYVTRAGVVSIHNSGCRLLDNLNGERILFAEWKKYSGRKEVKSFKVGIKLTVFSRVGLIHDVTSIITDLNINILDVMIKKTSSGLYNDYFLLDLEDLDKFDLLLDKLEGVKGVLKAVREDSFKSSE